MSLETMYHAVVSNWLITVRQVSKGLVLISICPLPNTCLTNYHVSCNKYLFGTHNMVLSLLCAAFLFADLFVKLQKQKYFYQKL